MVAESSSLTPIKSKARRITSEDVQDMAKLMAKRITETGACLILGIKPETWFKFKVRAHNACKFEKVLTHARESQLAGHMANIEAFQVKDWRASHALLQLKAPERFSPQAGQAGASVQAVINMGDSAIAAMLAKYQPKCKITITKPDNSAKQVETVETKQLNDHNI